MKPSEFFATYAHYAVESQRQTRVPASVSLAQAALESGWGEYAPGHNFFGIKGKGLAAKALRKLIQAGAYRHGVTPVPDGLQVFLTREWEDGRFTRRYDVFAAYATPGDAFDDHGSLFQRLERYRPAFQAADGVAFARAIAAAGYATDPGYADKLEQLIRRHGLLAYDSLTDLPA